MTHRPFPGQFGRLAATAVSALLLLAGTALGQDTGRSSTGRHRPRPVRKTAPEPKVRVVTPSGDFAWTVRAVAGNVRGGDIFEARVLDGNAVPWVGLDPGGFQTSRFKTQFENNAFLGLEVGRVLSPVWRVTVALSHSTIDVSANALLGQTGGRFRYDRFGMLALALGLERDLVARASAPYLSFGLVLVDLDPEINTSLAQTRLGGRLGLGYRQQVGDRSLLFGEIRIDSFSFDDKGFQPEPKPPYDPSLEVEFRDRVAFLGLLAGLEMRF